MIIRWQAQAQKDFEGILYYLLEQQSSAGPSVIKDITHFTTKQLQTAPLSGRLGRVDGTRELIVPRPQYVVVYRVSNDEIQVLSVRHQARLWPNQF
jgi:addiction module RelE/StbE family toxin